MIPGHYNQTRAYPTGGLFLPSFCDPAQAASLVVKIDDLMAAGTMIKDDLATSVSRTSWNGRDIVIKRYNRLGVFRRIENLMKGSRARRSWYWGHFLRDNAGVCSPEPLALIDSPKRFHAGSLYVVTEYVEARNLHHYLRDNSISMADRCLAIRQVKVIIDTLHRHYLVHGDMKHSNILVSGSGLVLTDLDAMRIVRPLSLDAGRRNRDIERFLRGMTGEDIPKELQEYAAEIFGRSLSFTGRTDDYTQMRHDNWKLIIRRGYPPEEAMAVLSADGNVCGDPSKFHPVPSSRGARVFHAITDGAGARRDIYVKRYLCRSILDFAKHLFRASRAARAFEASLMLRRSGFDSPEPLALLEKGYGPFCIANVLVTDAVALVVRPSVYLREYVERPSSARTRDKRLVIRQLGSVIGRMHTRGIFHGDLRLDNVLLQSGDSGWKFYFIDNERTRQFRRIPDRRRLKNLVQLNMTGHGITATDRVRFFTSYAEAAGLSKKQTRRIVSRVIPLTNRRLRIRQEHHAAD
jgi:tRNA A-37 threonylcarbamoyl transferase component Bud32